MTWRLGSLAAWRHGLIHVMNLCVLRVLCGKSEFLLRTITIFTGSFAQFTFWSVICTTTG